MTKPFGNRAFCAVAVAMMVLAGCGKTPDAMTQVPTAPATAGNVSDMDVTEHVKTALQTNDALKGFDITVATVKGDVRLNGVLDNQAQVDEAIRIARTSEGVHAVHDELSVKK